MIIDTVKKSYRAVVDHLTKALGILGAGIMSTMAWLDPASLREAAQTYLGSHAVEKLGGALFVLVILRGWYTGRKAQK
jgi:hypothetical protein